MKSLALLSIALASVAFANPETTSVNVTVRKSENNNHVLSFGPDAYWQHFNETKKLGKTSSNGGFGGARLRYEYVKPDAFYAGTDAMFAAGRVTQKVATNTSVADVGIETTKTALAANLEQRLGYTFGFNGLQKSSVTPFAGLGWYYTQPAADHDFSNDFVYAAAGFNTSTEVTKNFVFGVTGKALYSFYDRTHTKGVSHTTWDDAAWGFEVDVPLTWHLDQAHTWNVTFEPYIQDFDVSNHFMNVGGRLFAAYQF